MVGLRSVRVSLVVLVGLVAACKPAETASAPPVTAPSAPDYEATRAILTPSYPVPLPADAKTLSFSLTHPDGRRRTAGIAAPADLGPAESWIRLVTAGNLETTRAFFAEHAPGCVATPATVDGVSGVQLEAPPQGDQPGFRAWLRTGADHATTWVDVMALP